MLRIESIRSHIRVREKENLYDWRCIRIKKYGKFIDLPDYNNYSISNKGYIFDKENNVLIPQIIKNNTLIVVLNGIEHRLDQLILNIYVGELDGNIIYRDNNYKNCEVTNLSYDINISLSNDDFIINEKIFKPIPGFSNYAISDDGLIYSKLRKVLIRKTFNQNNYVVATIIDDNGYRAPRRIHRLVYMTYIGPIPVDMILDHKDGKKYNNRSTNLEAVYQHENIKRAFDIGLIDRRWEIDDIHKICKMLEENIPSKKILKSIQLSGHKNYRDLTMLIHNLINQKQHCQISKGYNIKNYNSALNKKDRVLSESKVIEIWNNLGRQTIKDLSLQYNVSTSTISKIRDGKTWKKVTKSINNHDTYEYGSTTIES